MKITHDKIADAMYVSLKKGKIARTIEVSDCVLVDVDTKGKMLGIELLFVSTHIGKKIAKKKSLQARTATSVLA